MNIDILLSELSFKAVKSSGPGGQHVNKTASKIELSFSIINSLGLEEDEKSLLVSRLQSKLSSNGVLHLYCSETRIQHKNKAIVIQRFLELIRKNSKAPKKRKKTKPSKSVIEKRLAEKKKNAFKKINRKPPKFD